MAVQELNFQGINRAITDYAVTGACEELINIRPTTGGLVPVKDFAVKMQDFPYDAVYVHYAGGTTNYIAIFCGADGHVDIIHIAEDGSTISVLASLYLSAVISPDDIHFASAGNYFVISICDKDNGIYETRAFLWNGSAYDKREANIPAITASVSEGTDGPEMISYEAAQYTESSSKEEIIDILNSAFNAIQEQNKTLCFGPIVIALAFKTTDGKVFWTGHWLVYDPTPSIETLQVPYSFPFYIPAGQLPSEATKTYPYGAYIVKFGPNHPQNVQLGGVELELTLSRIAGWSSETSMIQSVEVYASKPALYANPGLRYGETISSGSGTFGGFDYTLLPKIPYAEMELDKPLLYFQKSIPLGQLMDGDVSFTLMFGGNIQTTEATLEVDAGALTRYGKMLSYNSRFHYYDSIAKVGLPMPEMTLDNNGNLVSHHIFVVYNDGLKDRTLYIGTKKFTLTTMEDVVRMIISSSAKIKEVIVAYNLPGIKVRRYPMTASQTYNYSIYYKSEVEVPLETLEDWPAPLDEVTSEILLEEPDAINVTEQYNPFVFNVKHSYLAPGKVLDVQPQMVAVRDVTFGDYPLNVFTDRGTYALLQGNGQVLYGNFRSMSNLVSTANSVPTEHGTFFLAAGGLWAVAGSDAILISDALHLGPHKYIRDCAGYQALSASGVGYNVANYVSEVPFEEFTKCAKLSYNRFRDELIVSNNFYRYSYVLSLKYRQWFKIDRSLFQDNVGVNIAKLGNKPVVATVTSSLIASITGQIIKVNYIFNVQRESGLYTRVEVTLDLRDEGDIAELLEAALQETILSGTAVTATVDSDNGTLTAVFSFPATITGGVNGYTESLRGIPPTYSPTMVDSTSNMSISRTTEVIDLSEETDGSVRAHLQSRPFSFNGFGYSHVHRIVDMVRTALAGSDKLIVGLYGSDDLQNWTLLSYGARTSLYGGEPLEISQLRTPPAARSWRYYTICIGGTIPTDTDFGPVLVDYEPVIRRLG